MRIGLIIGSFTSGGGGAERYAQGLIRELRARGHEVHVVTRRWDEAAAGQGVVLHPVPVIRWPPFLRLLSFVLNCRRIVPTIGCDLVLSLERALRQDIHRARGRLPSRMVDPATPLWSKLEAAAGPVQSSPPGPALGRTADFSTRKHSGDHSKFTSRKGGDRPALRVSRRSNPRDSQRHRLRPVSASGGEALPK